MIREPIGTSEAEDIVVTDEQGQFRFTEGTGTRRFVVRLANKYFVVKNAQGALVEVAIKAEPGQPISLKYISDAELDVAQPSAFYWANHVRNFVSEALGSNELLNVQIKVNETGECNAYWTTFDKTITLFRGSLPASGNKCVNRAYVHTVFHEFGHAVDHAFGGITNTADGKSYSEGFGDALAILFTDQSCYGVDSRGPGTCLRDAANPPIIYPSDSLEIHARGRIYSGFTWELMQELSKIYRERKQWPSRKG